jgi:hypothetical protein
VRELGFRRIGQRDAQPDLVALIGRAHDIAGIRIGLEIAVIGGQDRPGGCQGGLLDEQVGVDLHIAQARMDAEAVVELVAAQRGQPARVELGERPRQGISALGIAVVHIGPEGLVRDQRHGKLVGHVILEGERDRREILPDVARARGRAGEGAGEAPLHVRPGEAVAQLGVVSLLEQDADRLAGPVQRAGLCQRRGKQKKGTHARRDAFHESSQGYSLLPPECGSP